MKWVRGRSVDDNFEAKEVLNMLNLRCSWKYRVGRYVCRTEFEQGNEG